jgi:hypothetical protein
MGHGEVGGYWDRNADTWIELSRAGYDLYRDWSTRWRSWRCS